MSRATVRDLGELLRTGKASSVELVQEALQKLREADIAKLNAMITVDEEGALREAAARDQELAAGMDRGPLHGIPIAHKDIMYTRGLRTTAGSLLYRDFVPRKDAAVVDKLAVAGAVSIGKTNLHELAFGTSSKNPHYGFVRNAVDPARVAGGSSGGSATLVAAGVVPLASGTDTGGSIRIPASFCGCVGFKPSYGRVSRFGVMPLSFALDHVGPIGQSVEDCALAMAHISGHDPHDPSSAAFPVPDFYAVTRGTIEGLRVGVPDNFYFDHVDAEIEKAVREAISKLERCGAVISRVTLPDIAGMNVVARVIQLAEFAALHERDHDASRFGSDIWALLQQGRALAATDYINAQRARTQYRVQMNALWKDLDVLAMPSTPIAAPTLDETTVSFGDCSEDVRLASTRFARAWNLTGEPAISLPCGRTNDGLPVGIQLVGRPFEDEIVLLAAHELEKTNGFLT